MRSAGGARSRAHLASHESGLDLDAVLLGKLLDPSLRVNILPLASVKGMALGADLDPNIGPGGPGGKCLPTRARHRRLLVCGVNALFHRTSPFSAPAAREPRRGMPVQQTEYTIRRRALATRRIASQGRGTGGSLEG